MQSSGDCLQAVPGASRGRAPSPKQVLYFVEEMHLLLAVAMPARTGHSTERVPLGVRSLDTFGFAGEADVASAPVATACWAQVSWVRADEMQRVPLVMFNGSSGMKM